MICASPVQLNRVAVLQSALRSDQDDITIVTTLPEAADSCACHPQGYAEITRFLDHMRPDLAVWMDAPLDPLTLDIVTSRRVPKIAIEATVMLTQWTTRQWVPGLSRAVLRSLNKIAACKTSDKKALVKKGAQLSQMAALGRIAETPPPLSYFEDERQSFAAGLGTRPVWLSAGVEMDELEMIAQAHRQASLRAHRLLLIIAPRNAEDADQMVAALRADGFHVATRLHDIEPDDATQIFVADGMEELGLWYRITPVTFLAGSFHNGLIRHPFEPAALGSAVLVGPEMHPFEQELTQLCRVGGAKQVADACALGFAVELLLAADKVAEMAHAAWDVTTQGANVAQQIAAMLFAELDQRYVDA
jgi:3-deoxy-D-manno-octulosonic-acid transferase